MNDRPKEGIYLDATLAVIGQQLEERIEQVNRRRRFRLRLGVAALAIATVASGSVAAVALTSRATDAAEASVALTVAGEIHCVDGSDADRPAYFSARFRTADGVEVDHALLCGAARAAIAIDDGTIEGAAPAELVGIARDLVTESARDPDTGEPEAVAGRSVAVDATSFGPLTAFGGPNMIVCPVDGATVVFAEPYGEEPSRLERAATCSEVAE